MNHNPPLNNNKHFKFVNQLIVIDHMYISNKLLITAHLDFYFTNNNPLLNG